MGRYQEFDIEDRQTEDMILRIIGDLTAEARRQGVMNSNDREIILDEADRRIGSIMRDLRRFMRNEVYATERELVEFAHATTNAIIQDLLHEAPAGDRGGRFRDSRDVGRLQMSNGRRSGGSVGFGLSSGIQKATDIDTDSRRTSRDAATASARSRLEEQEAARGKVFGNSAVPRQADPKKAKIAPKGTELTYGYAIIGSINQAACPLAVSNAATTPTANQLYNEVEHCAVLLDNAIAVDARDIEINTCFTNASAAIEFLRMSDSMLFTASEYCHMVHFPKIKFSPLPKNGKALLEAMNIVKKLYTDRKPESSIFDFLTELSMMMNQMVPLIRTIIQAQVIRRWNTAAKSIFALPKSPDQYLEANTWEHLLRFFTIGESTTVNNDEALQVIKDRVEILSTVGGKSFIQRVHGAVEDAFDYLFGADNGIVDLKVKNGEYLAGWEDFLAVIDKKYRAKDLGKMTPEQKDILFTQFHADNVCIVERMSIVFTNMPLHDLTVHDVINRVTAEDIPVGQLLKSFSQQKDYPQLLYHIDQKGKPEYIAHMGLTIDHALQLVTIKDSY